MKMANKKLLLEIPKHKKTEELLQESEEKYRRLGENFKDNYFFYVHNTEGVFTYISPSLSNILGYSADEFLTHYSEYLTDNPINDKVVGHTEFSIKGIKQPPYEVEIYHKNGTIRSLQVQEIPIFEDNCKVVAVEGIAQDITERKQVEEALKKSEQQFRTLVSNIPGIVYRCDNDEHWTMRYISNSIEDLTGYNTSDFIGNKVRSFSSIIHHKDREMVDRIVQEGVRSNQSFVIEYRIVSKGGSIRNVYDKGQGIFNKEGELLWLDGAIFDITEQKEIERELIKMQKLESLGVLAGGIAHDFNNSLQAILGYISLAELHAGSNSGIQKYLEEARKAILQSSGLTQQLLKFSKGGAPVKKIVSVSELIVNSARLALSGSNVKCELCIPDDLWPVEADKGQLNQVLSNLVINADQAMPAGGDIKVCAENINVVDKNLLPLQEGRYVKIIIEDYGTGISQEHIQKIFDPYFTTKKNGSGLGLATAYSIIKQHDGNITVESEIGVGTTFYIYLPASREEFQEEPVVRVGGEVDNKFLEKKGAGSPAINKGKILIMDDEYVIRVMLSKQLMGLEYEVEAVGEGSEAIRLYKNASEAGNPFDAVIMDLTISGGMGGKETIEKLLGLDPEARAIVMSGYAYDPIMTEFNKYGFSGVLVKPHEIHELDEVLQKVITEAK